MCSMCNAQGGQKRAWDLLELKVQMGVNCQGVLGTIARSCVRTVNSLICEAISAGICKSGNTALAPQVRCS